MPKLTDYVNVDGPHWNGETLQEVGGEITLTISDIAVETLAYPGQKPEQVLVMNFVEHTKVLPLRPANGKILLPILGDDTDMWPGTVVRLYLVETDLKPGVRVQPLQITPQLQAHLQQNPPGQQHPAVAPPAVQAAPPQAPPVTGPTAGTVAVGAAAAPFPAGRFPAPLAGGGAGDGVPAAGSVNVETGEVAEPNAGQAFPPF